MRWMEKWRGAVGEENVAEVPGDVGGEKKSGWRSSRAGHSVYTVYSVRSIRVLKISGFEK